MAGWFGRTFKDLGDDDELLKERIFASAEDL